MISPSSLSSLLKVIQSSDPKTAATLTKLLDIEVLKSLGENKYLLDIGGKQLTALSQQKLTPHEPYFAKFSAGNSTQPTLSHLVKIPKLFAKTELLRQSDLWFEPKDLFKVLGSKETLQNFKDALLKELASSPSKEHFQTLMPFLLSLHQNVLTLPMLFYDNFAFLQLKKRYNKKTKKSFLDFYAFFTHLGPISGVVAHNEVSLHVAFEETKAYLDAHSEELGCSLHIQVSNAIKPLYETKTQQILDIVT